jgi:hypothetical protein
MNAGPSAERRKIAAMMNSAFQSLLRKMQEVQEQGCDRAVFLTVNGRPEPATRALCMQLHAAGGDATLRGVMDQLQVVVNLKRMHNQMAWHHQVDLRELDICWNGIGSWRA